jgi:CHASE2 domain-containing sensor protein
MIRLRRIGAFGKVGVLVKALEAYKADHPKAFELALSVVFGILIEIVILRFQPPLLMVRRVGDDTADQMIRLLEQTTYSMPTSPAFVFIDIDDATWKGWGSPLVTPRAQIATLLERLARSKPLAIVLDVDLAYSDATDGKALEDFLADYKSGWPPLLLVPSLADDPDGGLPRLRLTQYDRAIGPRRVNGDLVPAKDNVMFASPLFERDGDGKVRRWKLLAEACDGTAPVVVPSMHLAAAMIARQAIYGAPPGDEDPPLKRMARSLAAFTPADCQRANGGREGTIDSLPLDRPIRIAGDDVSKRVIYRVAWKPDAVGLGPIVDLPAAVRGDETQLVEVRPARLVAAGDPNSAAPGVEGRIVVIGGSFKSSGDRYNTPLGVMPGSLMIINAIEALTQNGTPREFSTPFRIAISLAVIVVASLLTLFLRPIVAAAALSAFLLMLMLALLNRFQAGAVLDLAVPAVGAFVHDLWSSTILMARDVRRLGWRWVFKPSPHEEGGAPRPQRIAKEGAE